MFVSLFLEMRLQFMLGLCQDYILVALVATYDNLCLSLVLIGEESTTDNGFANVNCLTINGYTHESTVIKSL